jgi:hypothetical protein
VKNLATSRFWDAYNQLPSSIKKVADKNFQLLKENPQHPSLQLKKVSSFWSVRIGRKYRSLAVEKKDNLIWSWIGNHSEYENLIENR